MKKIVLIALGLIVSVTGPALAQQRSEFDRAIERAPQEAREKADNDARERGDRDANRERADRNVGHEGRVGAGEGASVGGSIGKDRVEVNVRVDTDPN